MENSNNTSARVGKVDYRVDADHVAIVSLDDPPQNRLTVDLVAALADVLETLDGNARCRVIVLRAEGDHFCAGAALTMRRDHEPSPADSLYQQALRLFETRKPIVAALRGGSIGGGLGLALVADFRVGSSSTTLSANFSQIGLHHGFGLSATLPRVVGHQAAIELLYTGRRVLGTEARGLGLLDELVDDSELDTAALNRARTLSSAAPLALEAIRTTMRRGLADAVRSAMQSEHADQQRLVVTADFAEGLSAFKERRPAVFAGR